MKTIPDGDLIRYLDGEMTGGERGAIEEALAKDAEARARLAAFEEVTDFLASPEQASDELTLPPPPSALHGGGRGARNWTLKKAALIAGLSLVGVASVTPGVRGLVWQALVRPLVELWAPPPEPLAAGDEGAIDVLREVVRFGSADPGLHLSLQGDWDGVTLTVEMGTEGRAVLLTDGAADLDVTVEAGGVTLAGGRRGVRAMVLLLPRGVDALEVHLDGGSTSLTLGTDGGPVVLELGDRY